MPTIARMLLSSCLKGCLFLLLLGGHALLLLLAVLGGGLQDVVAIKTYGAPSLRNSWTKENK